MPVKGTYLAMAGGGAVLLYSGLRGKNFSDSFRQVLSGKSPSVAQSANAIQIASAPGTGVGPAGSNIVPTPSGMQSISQFLGGGGTPTSNQALARTMLLVSHPTWVVGAEWAALVALWNQESGWNQFANNPSSGAYGIPQALPYTKMPKSAWPASAGGSSNPATQMSWGFTYIAGRYGDPIAAEAHERANNWY